MPDDEHVIDPNWPRQSLVAIPDGNQVPAATMSGLPIALQFVGQETANGETYNLFRLPLSLGLVAHASGVDSE